MSLTYTHTLIAAKRDYIPELQHVAEFFADLVKLGSAPLEPVYAIGRLSGEVRMGRDPMTGEPISMPRRQFTKVDSLGQITEALLGAEDYSVTMDGNGPPGNPPFPVFTIENTDNAAKVVEYGDNYSYSVGCCLRAEPVSMSDWHDEIMATPENAAYFDTPCRSSVSKATFHDPYTGAILELPGAGCARFWIEFEPGKWLLPKIETSLDVLAPPIVDAAEERFGVGFLQGCRWG